MRKGLWIFAIFILLLGGAVFFIGWVQFAVPPGMYGVLRSKTRGVDVEVLENGRFRWTWERLIPTNTTVLLFSPTTLRRPIDISGSLPSAQEYADFVNLKGSFSYTIKGQLSFSLKPSALPSLVSQENVKNQEDLDRWMEKEADQVTAFVSQRLRVYAEDPKDLEGLLSTTSNPRLVSEVEREFPRIEAVTCDITLAQFPNMALYQSTKTLYEAYLERQKEQLKPVVTEGADKNIADRLRFDELSRYGELLTRYPILLKYLVLEKGVNPSTAQALGALADK